jgi:hypothetical protein
MGRPKKSGNIVLEGDVLETYERLRRTGLGRNAAIKKTALEVKPRHPDSALSETTVKNILAKFQPAKKNPEGDLLFQVGSPDNWMPGAFRVVKNGNTYSLIFSKRLQFGERGKQINRKKFTFGGKKA